MKGARDAQCRKAGRAGFIVSHSLFPGMPMKRFFVFLFALAAFSAASAQTQLTTYFSGSGGQMNRYATQGGIGTLWFNTDSHLWYGLDTGSTWFGALQNQTVGGDLSGTLPNPTVTAIHFTVATNKGGTGDTSLTAHGVLMGNGTNAVHHSAAGTSGQAFISGGAGADGAYGALDVSTAAITGVVPVANTSLKTVVGGGGACRASMTSWDNPFGYTVADSSVADSAVGFVAPRACVARNLYVRCAPAPSAGDTVTVTIFRNGVGSIVEAKISETSQSAHDSSNAVSFSVGDAVQVVVVSTAGSAATKVSWGFDLQAN